eukprot:SAG11_NODE_6410_length_1319_cov_1.680328_1_plen_107_part_00
MYLAAEVLNGTIGAAADIFSLGIMLFELKAQVGLPPNGRLWHDLRKRAAELARIEKHPALQRLVHAMMDGAHPAARRRRDVPSDRASALVLPRAIAHVLWCSTSGC